MKAYLMTGVLCACSIGAYAQSVDRRVDAEPDGALVVSNVAGTVRITGADGRQVRVTGELAPNVERLDVLAQEGDVIVRVVLDDDRSRRNGFGDYDTNLRIEAPRGMTIEVETVSADVDVRGMQSGQRISSVSGDISTDAYGAELRLESVSGDLDVDSRGEPIVARTSSVSGDVAIRGPAQDVEAESVSGDIEVDAMRVTRVDVRSVSGDLSIVAELDDDARVYATTTSGDIELEWLGEGAAGYRLSTFSGDIYNCFGPRPPETDNRPPGVELRFSEGGSSARVEARTHSGDIDVCRR